MKLGGRRVELMHQEFELLRFLGQHRGRVFTREALLERAWGYRYAGGTRTVDIHVRRVRSKLGDAGSLIETVRNFGYKMRARAACRRARCACRCACEYRARMFEAKVV